ncbi:MAG: SurA N-terminal domain-containing protein [Dehalococcoidia bacterium]
MAKRRRIPTPAWDHQPGTLGRKLEAPAWQLWGAIGVILLVIASLGVVGWGFLSDYLEDRARPGSTAIEVGDREYSVRDFTDRAKLFVDENGGADSAFLVFPTLGQQLIEEAILLQYASEKEVTATDEEVKAAIALKLGIEATDPNFDARFQEELVTTELTEEEYRDIARANVLKTNLTAKFKAEVPATLPSVHYRQIQVADQATADDLVTQLEGGADFVALAAEHSEDATTKDTGGDKGFVPEGAFSDDALEDVLFSLEPNGITTLPGGNAVFVYQVLEKSDIQEVTDDQKNTLTANAYSEWLEAKKEELDVKNDLDFSTGDPDKIQYVVEHAALSLQQ